jgi:hypothetical protein
MRAKKTKSQSNDVVKLLSFFVRWSFLATFDLDMYLDFCNLLELTFAFYPLLRSFSSFFDF